MAFTYFFRDVQTLDLVAKYLIESTAGRSSVRVWDAGCASGQEPYTLAIILAESMGHFAYRNLTIEASDIDGSNLFKDIIEQGVYPWEELERVPVDILKKYFNKIESQNSFQIIDQIRNRLKFEKHDLLSYSPIGKEFSLVVCKNVLLHFQPNQRIKVVQMFHEALCTGGYLALEQTQKIPEEVENLFEKISDNAQVFRKIGK